MVVIAVAGGTKGLGKSIVDQIQIAGKHQIFVLTRKIPPTSSETAELLQCDYNDIEALTRILETNSIDTVISTINVGSEAASQAQLNLITAADNSPITRRFIPSHFVIPFDESDATLELASGPSIPGAKALKKTSLEYTHVSNGCFMDYWGMPNISSHLDCFNWGMDVANRRAVIPGSGNHLFSTTYSVDIARFIVAILDLEKWPKSALVSGSDTTFNEMVAIAQEVTGAKFDITYDDEESIMKGEVTLVSSEQVPGVPEEVSKAMMAEAERLIITGKYLLPSDNRLNDVFPDIRPMTIKELLTKAWSQ